MKTARWAFLLAFVGAVANAAEVYRSTDANGVPTFSDRPNANSETVYVATSRPPRSGNTAAAQPAAPASATAQRGAQPGTQQAAAGQQPPQQTPAEKAEERVKKCAASRERSEKYAVSHRLYRDTGNGQREYLTDGEIDEARARAAADVATWCG